MSAIYAALDANGLLHFHRDDFEIPREMFCCSPGSFTPFTGSETVAGMCKQCSDLVGMERVA